MKLPRRRLELGFINISALSWPWEFKAKVVVLDVNDTTHYELVLFFFFFYIFLTFFA